MHPTLPDTSRSAETAVPLPPQLIHPENRPELAGQDLGHLFAKIMIVDDEPINVKVLQKHLRFAGYQKFITTTDATAAMGILKAEQPDVVLLDIMMPQINGLQILEWIRADQRFMHMPVLILTASTESTIKHGALRLGATDFLAKPVDEAELLPRLKNALIVKAHQDHLAGYSIKLEREVQRRTAELEMSRLRVIQCLARAGEYRDDATGKHVMRVGRCAALLAADLGFTPEKAAMLELAAQLHDIGKIGVPDSILLKPGKLLPEEYAIMRKHCEYGKAIIDPTTDSEAEIARKYSDLGLIRAELVDSPILLLSASIAFTHHERFNGKGYPSGLVGEAIPIEGRITAIVDVMDALLSPRPYKPPFSVEQCVEIIEAGRGTEFDPDVVRVFMKRLPDLVRIFREYADDEEEKSG